MIKYVVFVAIKFAVCCCYILIWHLRQGYNILFVLIMQNPKCVHVVKSSSIYEMFS